MFLLHQWMPLAMLCALAAACGDGGSGGPGGSGGSAGTTGGSGGTTSTGGCPPTSPSSGTACQTADTCTYEELVGACATNLTVTATCEAGQWKVLRPVACEPLPAGAACNPVGTWHVVESGPYDNPSAPIDGYTGAFDLRLSLGDNGILYAEGYSGTLSADGCALDASTLLDEDCFEMSGEMFCTYIDRRVKLDFAQTPAPGTVTLTCTGECGFEATAPVTATAQ